MRHEYAALILAVVCTLSAPMLEARKRQKPISTCEAFEKGKDLDGKLVAVHGEVGHDFERLDLYDKSCNARVAIFLSDSPDLYPRPTFKFQKNRAYRELKRTLRLGESPYSPGDEPAKSSADVRMCATVLGRFDFGELKDSSGRILRSEKMGFLGEYKARLVVKEFISVAKCQQ